MAWVPRMPPYAAADPATAWEVHAGGAGDPARALPVLVLRNGGAI